MHRRKLGGHLGQPTVQIETLRLTKKDRSFDEPVVIGTVILHLCFLTASTDAGNKGIEIYFHRSTDCRLVISMISCQNCRLPMETPNSVLATVATVDPPVFTLLDSKAQPTIEFSSGPCPYFRVSHGARQPFNATNHRAGCFVGSACSVSGRCARSHCQPWYESIHFDRIHAMDIMGKKENML